MRKNYLIVFFVCISIALQAQEAANIPKGIQRDMETLSNDVSLYSLKNKILYRPNFILINRSTSRFEEKNKRTYVFKVKDSKEILFSTVVIKQ